MDHVDDTQQEDNGLAAGKEKGYLNQKGLSARVDSISLPVESRYQ